MREVTGAELLATYDDPFVRHQTDPTAVLRAFVDGDAVIIESRSHLPGSDGSLLMGLGPVGTLRPLAASVVGVVAPPARVSVAADAVDALPEAWRLGPVKLWHWMSTRSAPPVSVVASVPSVPVTEVTEVTEVEDDAEINALLDEFAPEAHARPGSPRVECWLGIRDAGTLVAVGALVRQPDDTGHLRAVTVVRRARGRGLGRELSAALTRRALHGGSGVATLGVYADNAPAVALYRGLGFEVVHTFASGPVSA